MLIIATNAAARPSDVASWYKAGLELPELPETELECSNVMHTSPAPEVTRSARHRPHLGHLHH